MALTKYEIAALNKAEAIIAKHTPERASWQFSFHAGGMYSTAAYFDSHGNQHMLWNEETLSGAIRAGIEIEATAAENADVIKLARIARLKDELAKLSGEAA